MQVARENEYFWTDVDEDKNKKPVGWLILGDEYNEEQKTEEQVSDFSEELHPSDLEEDDDDEDEDMDIDEDEDEEEDVQEEDYDDDDIIDLNDMFLVC